MTILGCIADDLMGGVELAAALVRQGMRTAVAIGAPAGSASDADALVVALDSRTIAAREARLLSLAALDWLRDAGCGQFFFKYGDGFESSDEGNIGAVADALVDALGCGFALACPAAPAFGRTVYQGHMFVGAALLSERTRGHPEALQRDANLVRALSRQTEGTVGLVPFAAVAQGAPSIRRAMLAAKEQGRRYVVVDAVSDADIAAIAAAASGQALVTGGTTLAMALAAEFGSGRAGAGTLPDVTGHAAVLAGSCARATLFQVGHARDRLPTLELDLLATPDAAALAEQALLWADGKLGDAPVVIATSTTPDRVAALTARLGDDGLANLTASVHATIAAGLVAQGVRRLLVSGGTASRAVAARLGITRLAIGGEIDAGMAWTFAEGAGPAMLLAVKAGDCGSRDLFAGAFQMLGNAS